MSLNPEKSKNAAPKIRAVEPKPHVRFDAQSAEEFLNKYFEKNFPEKLKLEDAVENALKNSPYYAPFTDAVNERIVIFHRALRDVRKFLNDLAKELIQGKEVDLRRQVVFTELAQALNEVERWSVRQIPY